MCIYIDILLITNIYTNYFLLKTTAKLIHNPLRNSKCILASLVGSLFSLIIFLPQLNAALLLLLRILSATIVILIGFSGKSFRETYHICLIFFFVSFIFAGIEYGITIIFNNKNMLWHNSMLYINISLITLVVSTIVSYIIICLFRHYLDSHNSSDYKYIIIITHNGKCITLDAVGDTCNNLTDVFTGKPVIVCSKDSLMQLLSDDDKKIISEGCTTEFKEGWRLIPFSTIHSDGLIPIFKPSSTIIKCSEKNLYKSADVYIGVVDRPMKKAIFNPKIL